MLILQKDKLDVVEEMNSLKAYLCGGQVRLDYL